MNVLFIDIDTLRPDHLGCYGYKRETSPCIDSIAKEGVVFNHYYATNAPCLPSRAALFSGKYGIRTGVVGHGGSGAEMRVHPQERDFKNEYSNHNLFSCFQRAGLKTASVSAFPERHSAWWFNAGFDETYYTRKNPGGSYLASNLTPIALDFIKRQTEDWFLHVHYWDPHTPYRAPESFGNPFEDVPLSDDWITDEIFEEHLKACGPHTANEIAGFTDNTTPVYPRHPGKLTNTKDMKNFIDQYDCGIRFTDDNIKEIIDLLKERGQYDDTAIIISSDHGENMGELGIYGEHATADYPTCRIPMIIKWPKGAAGIYDECLHSNIDLAPTIQELFGQPIYKDFDGVSYSETILNGRAYGREYAMSDQCAHVCQRSVRFEDYLYIRTVHCGYFLFEDEMLFNIKEDPHETKNIAADHKELCERGAKYILDWEYEMMKKSKSDADPLWTVMREGGPLHASTDLPKYIQRLKDTNREDKATLLEEKYILKK